jgi:hypothetical protein
MDMVRTGRSSLHVQRFQAQYLVSSQHPFPERVRARLDEAVAKNLPETLSTFVSRWFSDTDSTLWLVRRLEAKIEVNAAWEREQLARCWAAEVARTMAIALQAGGDGQNVLRFDSRAAYLAQFLVDLADGCAWGKWYYEVFDGLRMLPISAALRTAICDEPAAGLAALLEVPGYDLTGVLRVLTAQDARRILFGIAADGSPAGDEMHCFQALWKAWEATEQEPLETTEEWRNALHLYLRVCRDSAELSGPALRATTLALLRLARLLAGNSVSQVEKLLAALRLGDVAALYAAAGTGDAEILMPLIRCPADWVKKVGQALVSRYSGQARRESSAATDLRYTSFGGIFLLLSFLDTLPLAEATRDWPDAEEAAAVALLRFLIVVKCCGQPRAYPVFFDSLVRDLMGIDPSVSPPTVARWQARISQAHLETFLEKLATWQRGDGAVGGQTLVLARIPLLGGPVGVLLDCWRGVWLGVRGYHPSRPDRLVARLRRWLSQVDQKDITFVSDDVFVDALRATFPDMRVEERRSQSVIQMAEEDKATAEILARLDKLPDDLAYLSLPRSFCVSRAVDLAISVAAQGLMRAFAWRLPGFAGSSLPYLYSNFLDVSATMEDEPARRVVRLGQPPLNLVLGITGMARSTYQVGWLDERPFSLFQER